MIFFLYPVDAGDLVRPVFGKLGTRTDGGDSGGEAESERRHGLMNE